jgi:glycosyltransferase involved in cell wall biosynthesis
MAESLACGTPVVGYNIGSVPEIVKDGETGYVVDNTQGQGVDQMVEAIKKLKDMPEETYQQMRAAGRKRVEENFTIDKMVEGYIEIYKKLAKIDP